MKFHFDEVVEHQDSELVLRLLEDNFRDVSLKIIRIENQLVIYGVGPSSRTMNRNNKIVLQAISQHRTTVINAEVSFIASGLMGDMPQDIAVRSKIDQVFERMQAQLKVDADPHPVVPQTLQMGHALPTNPTTRPVSVFIEPASPAPPTAEQLPLQPVNCGQDLPEQPLTEPPELKAGKSIATAPTRPFVPESPATATFPPVVPLVPAPLSSVLIPEISQTKRKRSVIPLITFMAIFFILGTAYLLHYRYPATSLFPSKSKKEPVASMIDQPRGTHTNQVPTSTINAQAPSTGSLQVFSTNQPMDLKEWVGAWGAAMRTRNAQVQVSFYTDPVARYFLRSNVSRNQLLADKQSDIQKRERLWTVKAESIIVMQKTRSTATIRLTKHIITASPLSLIREQRIKTQLKLKSVDGSWKIAAEQALQ